MKRIISLFISLIIVSFSILNVCAMTPVPPEYHVYRYFEQFYAKTDPADKLSVLDISSFIDRNNDLDINYVLIVYNSKNAVQERCFNRFGNNNEYYEYSETTDLLFGSGLTIFAGKFSSNLESYDDDDFHSLEEIAATNPEIIDIVIDWGNLTQRVGYIGDADCDGEVTILDATAIQQHLALLDTLKIDLASDVDDNGCVDIIDATIIQVKLAGIE